MPEFKTNFQSIDKDIDRWMHLYGTPDKLSDGTPVIRGLGKATDFVINLYFEHEAWDALIKRVAAAAANWLASPELKRLSDALVAKKDVRRLKRIWGSVIAGQKLRFWEYHAFCSKGRVAGSVEFNFYTAAESDAILLKLKQELLDAVERAREIMAGVGETAYALQLTEDYKSIERETRGKQLPRPVARAIDEDCFWELIETAKQNSQSIPEQMDLLLAALETFKAPQIRKFQLILDAQMDALLDWDVWAFAYLAMGGCGDDAFEYFRSWLILQGRHVVETALEDVQKLGHFASEPAGVEGLSAIPEIAYENRSGKPLRLPSKRKTARVKGRQWEEADLQSRYPVLYKRFS